MSQSQASPDASPGRLFSIEDDRTALMDTVEAPDYVARLDAIVADDDRRKPERLRALLQVGAERFGVETGLLARPVQGLVVVALLVGRQDLPQHLIGLGRSLLLVVHVPRNRQNEREEPDADPVKELTVVLVQKEQPPVQLDEHVLAELLATRSLLGRFQSSHISADEVLRSWETSACGPGE